MEQTQHAVQELKEKILDLPGKKIVTISTAYRHEAFDISETGRIGYSPVHAAKFLGMLAEGMEDGAGVIIRQFTDLKYEAVTPNGKMFLPVKKLYGLELDNGNFAGLSSEEVKDAHCTDANGLSIPAEKGVKYCSFE